MPTKSRLIFNPITHIYRLDGVVIPGYSEISKAMGISDFSKVNPELLELARNFGEQLHVATKLWDLKKLGTLPEPLEPCLEEYKSFLKDYAVKIIPKYVEKPICSYRYRYGVTPDRVVTIGGEYAILEIKTTTAMSNSVKLQTAAQALAAEEYYGIRIKKRYGLQILPDKPYKLYPYKQESDKGSWLCFLGASNWLRGNK